jgi:Pyruvate/2-oxoacid:ferredoxin oxidoreductase gamma subunit
MTKRHSFDEQYATNDRYQRYNPIGKEKTSSHLGYKTQARAIKAGTSRSLNMVILGAYMALGEPVLSMDTVKVALKETLPSRFLEMNMRTFEMGMEEMRKKLSS